MLGKVTDNDPTIWAQPIIIFELQFKTYEMLEKNKYDSYYSDDEYGRREHYVAGIETCVTDVKTFKQFLIEFEAEQ